MTQLLSRILLVILLFPACLSTKAQKEITLEDIWVKRTFQQKSLYGVNSMNDGIHYSTLEKVEGVQEINQYQYVSGKKTATLLKSTDLKPAGVTSPIKIDSYTFSADESKILIRTNTEHIYRHSTREIAYIYELTSKKITAVAAGKKHRLATFSPDGNKIAYVLDNNLYYTNLSTKEEFQVTTDGKKNEVINGASDWVYEEELVLVKGFEWSPDNEKIAYYRFNEGHVKEFSMAIYDGLYPTEYKFKYPKAGELNSQVAIYVYDLGSKQKIPVSIDDFEYIPRIQWTKDPNILSLTTLNRHQNSLLIYFADVNTGQANEVFREEGNSYIEISDNIEFLEDNRFIWLSERSGFNNLYIADPNSGSMEHLTEGENVVTKYIGFDESKNSVYYMQADDKDPTNRYLYKHEIGSSTFDKLTTQEGFHRVKFSKNLKYYIDFHSTANSPLRITVNDPFTGKEVRVIQENKELIKKTKEYGFENTTFFSFKNRHGDDLNGWMIKPPNFNPQKKYPVLMYVYGGPGSQTVRNAWGGSNAAWYQLLAKKGYIIASIDNRGTGARGNKFRTATYKQLGRLETEDQIDGAKYLGSQGYVDASRIGIWGWSYGGYMTTLCMTKGASVFKTGIAVAPVTNWRYYDSIYTERYMQTPQENAEGYDDNSPINHVDKLTGNYLLVHGTADDNVHFQNTTELIKALIEAGKPFDLAVYPDKNHSIGGGKNRLHLYKKMTAYLENNL